MGFRRLEIGLSDSPVTLNGFEDSRRETGITVRSMVAGCLNPRSEHMSGTKLGSLDEDKRECAINSVRRHILMAQSYGCPAVVLRGCEVENETLHGEAEDLQCRLSTEGPSEELGPLVSDLVQRVQKQGQAQVEHFCRSIHNLLVEFPESRLAVEPGQSFIDLLNFESIGWVLDDLEGKGLGYWHDTGRVHMREIAGLPPQGQWLDSYSGRMVGIHLQDAAGHEAEMPPGAGEVDFRLVANYIPQEAERVVEINPRHGRGEILAAVQYLVDQGF